jgi:adenosylcobinamide kinase/adenosylcobinamide-phosphate guanylyltransferase
MLVLVTGGVASGKSEIAENIAVYVNKGKMAYIATMRAEDEECRRRVLKHRTMRQGKAFETIEIPYNLSARRGGFIGYNTALLECLSNLIANEMYLGVRPRRKQLKKS